MKRSARCLKLRNKANKPFGRKYFTSGLFILGLFLVDFLTKRFAVYYSKGVFMNYVANTGAAFGIFKGSNLIFIILTSLLILAVLYYYREERELRLGFNFILAGAFGNLFDRICYSYVVDFINLKYWPIFNLADVFIVFGVLYLGYKWVREKR